MSRFGAISLNYKERFVILFALNNLPSHDLKTAQMFRDLREPLRFDNITKFDGEEESDLPDPAVDFETAPQFLIIVPNILRVFFTRWGYPPPVARVALELMDRLEAMTDVSEPESEAPSEPESDAQEEQEKEDVSPS